MSTAARSISRRFCACARVETAAIDSASSWTTRRPLDIEAAVRERLYCYLFLWCGDLDAAQEMVDRVMALPHWQGRLVWFHAEALALDEPRKPSLSSTMPLLILRVALNLGWARIAEGQGRHIAVDAGDERRTGGDGCLARPRLRSTARRKRGGAANDRDIGTTSCGARTSRRSPGPALDPL